MATAITTELGPSCATGVAPLASLELFESPDSVHDPRALHAGIATTVQVLDGVVYLATEDDEWVLTPGDTVTVPAGTAFRRWNAGDYEARWVEVYCAA